MKNGKTVKKSALVFCLLYFVLFLIFYLPNYVEAINELVELKIKTPYLIVRGVLEQLFLFFIPSAAASILFSLSRSLNKKSVLVSAIFLAMPVLVYSLPYCYLYALSLGFDSIEGTVISLIFSILGVAIEWCKIIILFTLAHLLTKRRFGDEEVEILQCAPAQPKKRFDIREAYDFSSRLPFAVLVISLLELAYNLIIELINTVAYFAAEGTSYTLDGVMEILGTYLFLLFAMLVSHTASFCVAKYANSTERTECDAEI